MPRPVALRVDGIPVQKARVIQGDKGWKLLVTEHIPGEFEVYEAFTFELLELVIPPDRRRRLPHGGWRKVSLRILIALLRSDAIFLAEEETENNPSALTITGLRDAPLKLHDEFYREMSTYDLIKRQREAAESPHFTDSIRAVVLNMELGSRLNGLSDCQVGQLLLDFCWSTFNIKGPELAICTLAVDRLRRSTGDAVAICPICENEMFMHYGIDEPDFWQCDYQPCQHKIYVGSPLP